MTKSRHHIRKPVLISETLSNLAKQTDLKTGGLNFEWRSARQTFAKFCGRACALILTVLFTITAFGVDSAAAKSRAIRTLNPNDSAIKLPSKTKTIPFQFFTINQVLSQASVRLANSPATRLVLIHPPGTVMDVSGGLHVEPDQPFGMTAFSAPEGLLSVRWRKVENKIRADLQVLTDCRADPKRCPSTAARRFQAIVDDARALHGRARISMINRSINLAIRYMADSAQHGIVDVWSSPLTTFDTLRGDCEDYAIAKYVALREAGESADNLRVLLGHQDLLGHHAVLSVRNNGRWLILDNKHSVLVDSVEASRFVPLFAINGQEVKILATPYRGIISREPAEF